MKILYAVMGAIPHALNGIHQASRETWMRDISNLADSRFFVGNSNIPIILREDEIRINALDDKRHILYKTVEILRWAIQHNYDMILKVDTDTYINIPAIMEESYDGLDYIGSPVGRLCGLYGDSILYSFIQGSAMWLSAKAAQIIIDEAIPTMLHLLKRARPYTSVLCPYPHAEDLWIGQVLTPYLLSGELHALADDRYAEGPLTFHFAIGKDEYSLPKYMEALYKSKSNIKYMQDIHNNRISMFRIT